VLFVIVWLFERETRRKQRHINGIAGGCAKGGLVMVRKGEHSGPRGARRWPTRASLCARDGRVGASDGATSWLRRRTPFPAHVLAPESADKRVRANSRPSLFCPRVSAPENGPKNGAAVRAHKWSRSGTWKTRQTQRGTVYSLLQSTQYIPHSTDYMLYNTEYTRESPSYSLSTTYYTLFLCRLKSRCYMLFPM